MEDRHKFKLWDKKRRCFLEQHDIAIGMWKDEVSICVPHYMNEMLEVVLCTGLKDMCGKLIYEGDILRIDGTDAVVEWLDDGWKLVGEHFSGDNLFPQIRSVEGADDGKAMWGKIIGNRFEENTLEETKCCIECKEEKVLEDFHNPKAEYCKICAHDRYRKAEDKRIYSNI